MFKSIQVKIILIIMILAILMFSGYGIFTIQTMRRIELQEKITNQNIIIFLIILGSFIIISVWLIF